MKKNNTQSAVTAATAQPAPEMETVSVETVTIDYVMESPVPVNALVEPNIPTASGMFAAKDVATAKRLADQAILSSEVRQILAEAADYSKKGAACGFVAGEAKDLGAGKLLSGIAAGTFTLEETNALIGDVYGFKLKADLTPGKTPAGDGEHIRKRLVRLATAYDYVMTGEGGKYFKGLPSDEIASILAGTEQGQSVWAAYDLIGKVKQAMNVRLDAPFDPAKVKDIVDALTGEGGAERLAANEELVAAYGSLLRVLKLLNGE